MVGKFAVAAVLVLAACAKPEGANVGGGPVDMDVGTGAPDLAPVCGDEVCDKPAGETCTTCQIDCGSCNCPMGFGDCDKNASNGCETNLNTVDNCGGCGLKCQAVGGTNKCVLAGTGYSCVPTCDATHADCDKVAANGCETDLTTVMNCGACGTKCTNAHGTTACINRVCSPTCDPGFGACAGPNAGCNTNTAGDPDNCGNCGRSCGAANVATRQCSAGSCAPLCNAPFSDCAHPAGDDGCETNATTDPGENDNACGGQVPPTVQEGATSTLNTNRILPSGDTDTYTYSFNEGSHICFPGTSQHYWMTVSLVAPQGNLQLKYNLNGCDNTWSQLSNSLCVDWGGTCSSDDDRTFYFQVAGSGQSASCLPYTLSVKYCTEGDKCGCP